MLLLIGPPAAGKTTFCLDRMRESLRARQRDAVLLVPTTTMAEHLRNQLAREDFVFSPQAVSTFGKYVADTVRDLRTATSATLEILCAEVLETADLDRYREVRDFPGFRSALVRVIEEFAGAGGSLQQLAAAGAEPDFLEVYAAVLDRVRERGLVLRPERLRTAAARIREGADRGKVLVTGFFNFTPPEIAVLRALDEKADLTVTLPESPSGAAALGELRSFASEIRMLDATALPASRSLTVAPSLDAEAGNVARRILEEHSAGRPFRDMGVIVRSEQPLVPVLRTAFDRFGIPARFYFAPPLAADPVVRYLSALVDAALAGWEFEPALTALRMHGSPLERADHFDHLVREHMPARGLSALRELAPEDEKFYFDDLAILDGWSGGTATAVVWAGRFEQLVRLYRPGPFRSGVSHERALIYRAQAAAVEHFRSAVHDAAEAVDAAAPISFAGFWRAIKAVLRSASLRVVDRRRDVVHVIDAVEARQWRLPVVFLAGLLEGEFPKHYAEDPVVPDPVRARMKALGVPVRTSADRQAEETFLFDLALSRASERLEISYAQLNAKGEPNLPSFLLERAQPYTVGAPLRVAPRPARSRAPEPNPFIYSDELRAVLTEKSATLSASRIERYIKCPFGDFAEGVLRLAEPPDGPWERLGPGVQGSIAHFAFELHYRDGVPVAEAFDRAFARFQAEKRVPDGYRTEAIRLELQHGVELFVRANCLPRWARTEFEHEFKVPIAGDLTLKGKIDRIEIDEHGNALVIDYKYKNPMKLRETAANHEQRKAVQGGVYLIAAEQLGYKPVGVVFAGFKESCEVRGWVEQPFAPEIGIQSLPAEVRQRMIDARELAFTTAQGIREGRIAPEPEEDKSCWWCSYLKICRADAAKARRLAGGAA